MSHWANLPKEELAQLLTDTIAEKVSNLMLKSSISTHTSRVVQTALEGQCEVLAASKGNCDALIESLENQVCAISHDVLPPRVNYVASRFKACETLRPRSWLSCTRKP